MAQVHGSGFPTPVNLNQPGVQSPEKHYEKIKGQEQKVTNDTNTTGQKILKPDSTVPSKVQANAHIQSLGDGLKEITEKLSSFLSKPTSGVKQAMRDIKTGVTAFVSTTASALKGIKDVPVYSDNAKNTGIKVGSAVGGAIRYIGKRLQEAKHEIKFSAGFGSEAKFKALAAKWLDNAKNNVSLLKAKPEANVPEMQRTLEEAKEKVVKFQKMVDTRPLSIQEKVSNAVGKQFESIKEGAQKKLQAMKNESPKEYLKAKGEALMGRVTKFATEAKQDLKFSAGIGQAAQKRKEIDKSVKRVKQQLTSLKEQLSKAVTYHANASQIKGPNGETARQQTADKVKYLEGQVQYLEGQLEALTGYQNEHAKIQEKVGGALSEKFESIKNSELMGRVSTTLGDIKDVAGKVAEGTKKDFETIENGIRDMVVGKKKGEDDAQISKGLVGHASDLGSTIKKAGRPTSKKLGNIAKDVGPAVAKPFKALAAMVVVADKKESVVVADKKESSVSQNQNNILIIGDFFRPANANKYKGSHLVFVPDKNEFQILPSKKTPKGAITDPAQVKQEVVNVIKETATELASQGTVAAAHNFEPIGGGRAFGLSTIPQWMEGNYKLDTNQSVQVLVNVAASQNLGIAKDNAKVFEENRELLKSLWNISDMPDDWQIEAASDSIGASLPAVELFGIRESNNFLGDISQNAVVQIEQNLKNLSGVAENLRQGKLTEAETKLKELNTKLQNKEITEEKYNELKGKAESAVNKWKNPDANTLVELIFSPTTASQAFNQSAIDGMRKMFDKYCDNKIGKSYQPAAKWLTEESPGFTIYAKWNNELQSKLKNHGLGDYIQDRKEINDLCEAAGSNTSKLPELMKKMDEFIKKYPPEAMQDKQADLKQIKKEMGKPLPLYVKTSHPKHHGKILPDSVFGSDGQWREPTEDELADAETWERTLKLGNAGPPKK